MNKSATAIQKWVRGRIARKFFEANRQEFEANAKSVLEKQLAELSSMVKRCGTENRLTLPIAAAKIQAVWRARTVRRVLQPYFKLYRRVNPVVS